jgi:hypothetical protein
LTDRGQTSGKLTLASKTLPFSGVSIDLGGNARFSVKRAAPATPLEVTFHLSDSHNAMSGWVSGQVSSTEGSGSLTALRQQAGGEWKGSYTFLLYPDASASPPFPPGTGAGTLTMDAQGRIKLVGTLGDGSVFTANSAWNIDGGFFVYVPLYSNKGLLNGRGILVDWTNRLVGGKLSWNKPATGGADHFYPEGFNVQEVIYGSVYQPPARGRSVLNWSQGQLELSAGNLANSLTMPIKWANNKLVVVGDNPLKCTATITASSGLIQGSMIHPDTGKKTTLKGAVVQSLGSAAGWFLGTNQGGAFLIHSNAPANP